MNRRVTRERLRRGAGRPGPPGFLPYLASQHPRVPGEIPTHVSQKASRFSESVIREMTRRAAAHGAVNLAQGFPDFPCLQELKDAACRALQADVNQYAVTWGAKVFRDALAAKTRRFQGLEVDPEAEITVTCGSTEGMIATLRRDVELPAEVGDGCWP